MSIKRKKRNEESPNGKGRGCESNGTGGKGLRGSESPNGKGAGAAAGAANGLDSNELLGKKLRKKLTDGASTPVAAADGTGSGAAVEALRSLLDSGLSGKKSKKSSKKTCKKSKKCKENNTDSCWE
jgi:hypothetical protein